MDSRRQISTEEARSVGKQLGINWTEIDLEQFRRGIEVEIEYGLDDPESAITDNYLILTGKIVWVNLKEIRDYYTRIDQLEAEG